MTWNIAMGSDNNIRIHKDKIYEGDAKIISDTEEDRMNREPGEMTRAEATLALNKLKKHELMSRAIPTELKTFIITLKSCGYAVAEIVDITRLTRSQVQRILRDPDAQNFINPAVADAYKAHVSTKLRASNHLILDNVTPEKIEKASLKDLAVSFGVFEDKLRLINGESTENVAIQVFSKKKINTNLNHIEEQRKKLRQNKYYDEQKEGT